MSYADKLGVPYAILLGEDEIAQGVCTVKDMRTGNQVSANAKEAAALILESLADCGPIILEG